MTDPGTIKNTVANKALVTIDLGDFYPKENECAYIDVANYLFKGLILKESDFREQISKTDFNQFRDKYVGIYCSADAIIPIWVYMVLAAELSGFAKDVLFGKKDQFPLLFLHSNLNKINAESYDGKRLVIKGCGDKPIDEAAFTIISAKLATVARSIMYGEPCSTVPVFKRSAD
jgi:hypothetical protein